MQEIMNFKLGQKKIKFTYTNTSLTHYNFPTVFFESIYVSVNNSTLLLFMDE